MCVEDSAVGCGFLSARSVRREVEVNMIEVCDSKKVCHYCRKKGQRGESGLLCSKEQKQTNERNVCCISHSSGE